ncbi:ribbon-helix-helix protein, CopG family [Marmoricola sp. Leaf446]|uniref:ribbon-helix-helix protein, CopG family n=1 Tax=Marmoricola sp. Leaf446 TaxID=1736379 RepID=UPI0012E3C926|nr:ribbon-helix-helix protein, CopG family [Marmoricola sp. Leaf446]
MTNKTPEQTEKAEFSSAVLSALGAFAPARKLTTTLQVRVTDETAESLDALVAQARDNGIDLSRSDLVRAAVTALVAGTNEAEETLARSA